MSKKANPTLIGAFVLGAVALLLAVLLVISGGRFSRETRRAVAYFEGTMRGLQVGSGVMFRGVPIGKVTFIQVVVDTEALQLTIPVVMELDLSSFEFVGERGGGNQVEARIGELIEQGLRAQLVVDSLVTGQVLIELAFHPKSREVYRAPPGNEMLEIPTLPSDLQVAMERVENLVGAIEEMPIEEIMDRLASALEGFDRLINSEEVTRIVSGLDQLVNSEDTQQLTASLRSTLDNLDTTLDDASSLLKNADAQVEPLAANLNSTLEEVNLVLGDARKLVSGFGEMASVDSELYFNANATLRELESAMRALRGLVDFLDRNPDALLKGRRQP